VTWSGKAEFLLTAVGFAVGLGNVWRFPHLCYSNGGGAFLLPYALMLALAGLPLFFLELAFGQYAALGTLSVWRVRPLFKGVGYTMLALSLLVALYYNVIMAFCLFYFFASFTRTLPWANCYHLWNSVNCSVGRFTGNGSSEGGDTIEFFSVVANETIVGRPVAPAVEYWESHVLGMSDDTHIGHLGSLRGYVTLCLLLSWVIVFLCIIKGIKTSGKVSHFHLSSLNAYTLHGSGGLLYGNFPVHHSLCVVCARPHSERLSRRNQVLPPSRLPQNGACQGVEGCCSADSLLAGTRLWRQPYYGQLQQVPQQLLPV
jgi:hypothetical protein